MPKVPKEVPKGPKVALCMICKNERQNIAGLMDDVCEVLDEVHVVDTGSTDGTLEILKQKQSIYPRLKLHHFDWCDDFSKARNYSFSLAGKDIDWIFWVDGDDRVNKQDLINAKTILSNSGVDAWLLPYIYSKYPDGSPQSYLTRERFLRKSKNPKWIGAIHETVDISCLRQANYEGLKIEHNRDGKFIEPKRNLKILEKEFQKNPNDHRTAYYYAKELFDHIDPKAKEKLIHYLTVPHRYWDDEIGARFRLAKTYIAEKNLREAILTVEPIYHLDATRKRSEYYFIYGEVEIALGNYLVAIDWYKRCLYDPPGPPRVLNLEYWTWHPCQKIAMCYRELGDWEKCFEYADSVMKTLPSDQGAISWYAGLQSYQLQAKSNNRVVLEVETNAFLGGYKYKKEPLHVKSLDGNLHVVDWTFKGKTPFLSNSIDGIVVGNFEILDLVEIHRILKPCGFMLLSGDISGNWDLYFNILGTTQLNNITYHKLIKVDEKKPSIGYYEVYNSSEHAQYRYRICNLVLSAILKGHRVINSQQEKCDIFVGLYLDKKYGKTNVLELCEKLDHYHTESIENADVINCCSPLLASYIKEKYPNKLVMNVDDHFELPKKEWVC